jgi:hypothetical protein
LPWWALSYGFTEGLSWARSSCFFDMAGAG